MTPAGFTRFAHRVPCSRLRKHAGKSTKRGDSHEAPLSGSDAHFAARVRCSSHASEDGSPDVRRTARPRPHSGRRCGGGERLAALSGGFRGAHRLACSLSDPVSRQITCFHRRRKLPPANHGPTAGRMTSQICSAKIACPRLAVRWIESRVAPSLVNTRTRSLLGMSTAPRRAATRR